MTDWISACREACIAVQDFTNSMRERVADSIAIGDKIDPALAEEHQRLVHGYAWMETTAQGLVATADWATRAHHAAAFGEIETLVLQIGFAEYLAQLSNGVAMSQSEIVRPHDFGLEATAASLLSNPSIAQFIAMGNTAETRKALAERLASGERPYEGLGDETLDLIRDQFRAFTADKITPHAHAWHLADDLIPQETIDEMARLGVFGVCVDEQYGGLGMGKLAMSLVSEELSRGWICAGSLGTRSEIAGELIGENGTDAQKAYWLPKIADGSVLPTAVFTEPDTGSDLASVRTKAVRGVNGEWQITGAKTWITHAARADVMTVLCRTNLGVDGYGGLSMLIAKKTRGTDGNPFPDDGIDGSEIEVLGYRGMKEYALGFDGFAVAEDALLGGAEGQGFKQLMRTFEGARIQTAARAIGVGWNAFDLGVDYALGRKQFGKSLIAFPRVADKLAMMVVELIIARELTYAAARQKDRGERCDIEAGMAKLLAARVAWSAADNALQVHGGNGYALEYPISRVLADARILNIFEGAGEIQAQVIGRGLVQAGLIQKRIA